MFYLILRKSKKNIYVKIQQIHYNNLPQIDLPLSVPQYKTTVPRFTLQME